MMKPMAKRNPTKYQQRRRVFLVYLPAAWVAIAFVCWGLAWLIKKRPVIGALLHSGSSPAAGTPAALTFSRNPCSARLH